MEYDGLRCGFFSILVYGGWWVGCLGKRGWTFSGESEID